jgi:PAS domain S-box-containing protein
MRNNQPVTQREISLAPQQKLISATDVRGVITYCNDAFVEISGFDRADLIGALLGQRLCHADLRRQHGGRFRIGTGQAQRR